MFMNMMLPDEFSANLHMLSATRMHLEIADTLTPETEFDVSFAG